MQKHQEQIFMDDYEQSSQKKQQIKKKQHLIKKDKNKKQKIKRQSKIIQSQDQSQNKLQPIPITSTQQNQQCLSSKYQRLQQFWKTSIQNYYRKQITQSDKHQLKQIIQQKGPTVFDILKNRQSSIIKNQGQNDNNKNQKSQKNQNNAKISLEYLEKYCGLIQEINLNGNTNQGKNCQFIILEQQSKREFYVVVVDEMFNIEKAIEVTEQQLNLLAKRQQIMNQIKKKIQLYIKKGGKHQHFTEIQLQLSFLAKYNQMLKHQLDCQLQTIYNKAITQAKYQPPVKVQQNYITFLIKKNLKKSLQNQQIDYFNHFKKIDINEHVSGLVDSKPITDKKDFDEYIKKRKLKRTGKKARWVLKTACGGCFSYHYQLYNPLSFCSQCHIRYHKYCYIPKNIPKNQNICQSCFLAKNNQTKRSRINQCQLCGTRGFLYLPMDQSNNAHIFCMLINGLWKFQNTQIVFHQKYIENSIENQQCVHCKQTNSCIYKCEKCNNYSHPLCGYVNGWDLKLQKSQKTGDEIVKLQCCAGVDKQKNQKKRRFVLNYKKCVFNQCQ